MIKRFLSLFLTFALCLAAVPSVSAQAASRRKHITDRSAVDGSQYTSSVTLAKEINAILDGDANIYADKACTIPVKTVLGTSPVKNNGIRKYVGSEDGTIMEMGTSCYIYANGVYYTLFGETTGNGVPGENSEKLNIHKTASRRASYKNFKAWGVRQGVGALIRASGHSLIVLDYDEQGITYLDGNGDGHGLISVNKESWDKFFFSYVYYIIQPKEHHYSALYATGSCGDNLTWYVDESDTLHLSGSGDILYPAWNDYSDRIQKVVVHDGFIGIGNGVFYNCPNLKEIEFLSAAPIFAEDAFWGVDATVHYPATEAGWHNGILQSYGGAPEWVPYGMTELEIIIQPQSVCTSVTEVTEICVEAKGDGLSYCWYLKQPGESVFVKSSVSGPVYAATITEFSEGMQVVCVVTDQYGNTATTQPAYLRNCDTKNHEADHTKVLPQTVSTPVFSELLPL